VIRRMTSLQLTDSASGEGPEGSSAMGAGRCRQPHWCRWPALSGGPWATSRGLPRGWPPCSRCRDVPEVAGRAASASRFRWLSPRCGCWCWEPSRRCAGRDAGPVGPTWKSKEHGPGHADRSGPGDDARRRAGGRCLGYRVGIPHRRPPSPRRPVRGSGPHRTRGMSLRSLRPAGPARHRDGTGGSCRRDTAVAVHLTDPTARHVIRRAAGHSRSRDLVGQRRGAGDRAGCDRGPSTLPADLVAGGTRGGVDGEPGPDRGHLPPADAPSGQPGSPRSDRHRPGDGASSHGCGLARRPITDPWVAAIVLGAGLALMVPRLLPASITRPSPAEQEPRPRIGRFVLSVFLWIITVGGAVLGAGGWPWPSGPAPSMTGRQVAPPAMASQSGPSPALWAGWCLSAASSGSGKDTDDQQAQDLPIS
jgi:hypothetical protein